ncbi:MAG: hypothetical protein FWD27_01090 [Coriobacteriia bacterium]|nr:hypothetical protein [Coriobacteriia bacterium]
MEAIQTGCKRCGSEEFELMNPKTGEVICAYCRNRWIETALIQRTETEKFLAEQAKRPQVTVDNSTETDKQLMDLMTKAAGAATGGCVNRVAKAVVLIVVVVIAIVTLSFCGLYSFMGS